MHHDTCICTAIRQYVSNYPLTPRVATTFRCMVTHGGASEDVAPDEWMSADDIAALSRGRATANTVRSWWRSGALEFDVFPELGTKSNKRSNRAAAEQFLRRKYGNFDKPAADRSHATPRVASSYPGSPPAAGAVADLVDTLASVRASADAVMQGLIAEAEANAVRSRAIAEADEKRVETLKHLQTMLRGYDLALSTHLQPPTVGDVSEVNTS